MGINLHFPKSSFTNFIEDFYSKRVLVENQNQ